MRQSCHVSALFSSRSSRFLILPSPPHFDYQTPREDASGSCCQGKYSSSSLPDDACALTEVLSLLLDQSDIFALVICFPSCFDFGELPTNLASIQPACLQYVKHLTSQDLKTATLAPDHRAASQQLLCLPKWCFFPKFYISDCILGPRAFFYCGLAQNSFHFLFTLKKTLQFTKIYKFTVREDVPKSFLELLCIEIKPVLAAPFLVMAWYRPPNATAPSLATFKRRLKEH